MDQERKPSDDLIEGFGLIFRAARNAAKQIDIAKIDKGLDKALNQVGRVVTGVGRVVADEINRMTTSSPPWAQNNPPSPPPPSEESGEGPVWASTDTPPSKDEKAPEEKKP